MAAHKLLLSIPVYVVHFCKAGKCLRIVNNKDRFTHTFSGIEDLCAKRDDLHRQILQEEEEKQKIQNDIRILTERLAQVTPPPTPPSPLHTHTLTCEHAAQTQVQCHTLSRVWDCVPQLLTSGE